MIDTRTATWPEVKEYIDRKAVAILAFGAQEEHGPHLPLSTDTIESAGLARRLAEELDAMLLPPIPYGDSWGATGFPGTVSINFSTIYALVLDIGKSLKFNKVHALIVINGHFGNHNPIELAARELVTQHAFPTLMLDFPNMVEIASQVCESKPAAPTFYHADEFETSLVLAHEPSAVRMERAQ
ncbi:MAG TPA: creatininase family protein, partial [Anaerolineaceae bacterium]|nr:creatininase family protein [Anaerolineaceae bacterium]